jgi:glycine dehydrogenase subunit 1
MEVANASMYDGATAFVEGALMACRLTKRGRVLVSAAVNPEWIETLLTYCESGLMEVDVVDAAADVTDRETLAAVLDETIAAVLVSSPAFLGGIEDVGGLARAAHDAGALLVVATNPILLGVMEPPGALGADIVVGEGQPLGNAMSYGGPGLGLFACRAAHVRQMPGRLVGRTVDADGNSAFVLTLSTREQHIRREKATSNICSNHALNALAAGVYLASVGPEGLRDIATACVSKAHYLRDRLIATGRFTAPWEAPFGYEFALRYEGDASEMYDRMLERGFLAGVVLESEDDGDLVLFAVTEKRTRAEIDAFVEEVASL